MVKNLLNFPNPDDSALIWDSGEATVAELVSCVESLLKRFADVGLTEGEPVLIECSGVFEFATSFIALADFGASSVPLHGRNIASSDALEVTQARFSLRDSDIDGIDICLLSDRVVEKNEARVLLMTSGSTGDAKVVSVTLEQMQLNAFVTGARIGIYKVDKWMVEMGLGFTSGIAHLLMAWSFGVTFTFVADWSDEQFEKELAGEKWGYGGSPIKVKGFAERFGSKSELSILMSSGDFLSGDMVRYLRGIAPQAMIEKIYGLSEVSGRFCHANDDELKQNPDSLGYPLPGFRLKFEFEGNWDDHGELCIRSPFVGAEYRRGDVKWNISSENGWFYTGDVGELGVRGELLLTGRTDDVIKFGGEKVDRASIEAALTGVLSGYEYCVLPMLQDFGGKAFVLFVGAVSNSLISNWREISTAIRSKLPTRFLPLKGYIVPDGLPVSLSGKIDRSALLNGVNDYPRIPF